MIYSQLAGKMAGKGRPIGREMTTRLAGKGPPIDREGMAAGKHNNNGSDEQGCFYARLLLCKIHLSNNILPIASGRGGAEQ
jgi:hypothetical protein